MSWRDRTRRLLPYAIVGTLGFLLAYLVVFFFIFPTPVVPREGSIPDVTGIPYEEAVARLKGDGFRADTAEQMYHGAAGRGIVLGQRPRPGEVEERGALVLLDISLGRRQTRVPDVVGAPESQARAELQAEGFTVAEAVPEASDLPRGQVIATIPGVGQLVTLPVSVRLRTSAGPTTVAVPDVTGRPFAEAKAMLEQVGLTTGRALVGEAGSGASGAVVRQAPEGGTSARAGTRVRLTVAP
jgi:beta-lactam-binding protein with PASTA domain